MIKKTFFLTLPFIAWSFFALLPGQAISQLQPFESIRLSYFQYEPHIIITETTEGQMGLSGALYEFLENHIAPEMGVQLVWSEEPTNLARQLLLLGNNDIDASATMRRTPERELIGAFTASPYHLVRPVLAVLNENPLQQVNSVDDIVHLTIGYAESNFIPDYLLDERVQFSFVNSSSPITQNLMQLMAGRIDAMYVPAKSNLLMELEKMGVAEQIRIIDLPEPPGASFVVFSKQNQALIDRYNAAFDAVGGQATYFEILGKYINLNQL